MTLVGLTIMCYVDADRLRDNPVRELGPIVDEVVASLHLTPGDAGTIVVPGRGAVGRWEIG